MFDDPDIVDPLEMEAQALRELEAGMVVEGPLQASSAACIGRLKRLLKELYADYVPSKRSLEFSRCLRSRRRFMGLVTRSSSA